MVRNILLGHSWVNSNINFDIIQDKCCYKIVVKDKILATYITYSTKEKISVEKDRYISVNFDASYNGLSCELFAIGYKKNVKVSVEVISVKYKKLIDVTDLDEIRFMLRIVGKGEINIKEISIEIADDDSLSNKYKAYNSNEKFLVLTNVYPSYTDLYRNGFVHRRVKLYQEEGLKFDVFSTKGKGALCKYEYDGVNVFEGNKDALEKFLIESEYKKILIHFIDKDMYSAIQATVPNTKLLIWIHGVETEKWFRRMFNLTNEKEVETAIEGLENNFRKLQFMNEIYSRTDNRIKFIFVSKWFKEEVAEVDAKAKVIEGNYEIIPNIVDSEIFKFVKKDPIQRFNILTIRPFASRKYANDLSAKAILELAKYPEFEKMKFSIYGEGKLFKEIVEPLRGFNNVNINERFLNQDEIASLHKENGIFLCPTRLDSQGVSMCEAMSSGLIPVTCGVTAIPEFVPSHCGILAREDNYLDLAEGILKIVRDEKLFINTSEMTSKHMSEICSKKNVISKEIKIIKE